MRRLLSGLIVATALALSWSMPSTASAQDLDLSNMTEEERGAFRMEVRRYLLENPEVIFEAIQILEQRRSLAAQNQDRELVTQNAAAIFEDGFSWVGGNPDGDVTLVEFIDYRCGFCKRAHPEIQELLARDPNIRYVVKEFPILGPESVRAARIALAALEIDPGSYGALNDAMLSYRGNLTEQVSYRLANRAGYDIAELKARVDSTEIEDQINQTYQLAQRLGLQGTPAFIVGTEIIRGYLPVDEMMAAVQEARVAQN